MNMPLTPSWTDIAIRLALTMLAGQYSVAAPR